MAGTPSESGAPVGRSRRAGAGAARLAYGVVQLLLARRVVRRLVAGGGFSARWMVRAAGLRHVVQSAAVTLLGRRGHEDGARVAGAAADLAQALVLALAAVRSPRWGTAASLDRAVSAALTYADVLPARRPQSAAPPADDSPDEDSPVRHDNDLDMPPRRPDPFAFPAGPTALDSRAARERHEHEVEMQQVVQELVATCEGRPVDEVMDRLLEALAARHLGPYPHTWLQAIAGDAAAGRTYVVTKVAAEKAGIPEPLPGPPTDGVV